MNLEVLITTMHQNDFSLIHKMRIESDAILLNQCSDNYVKEYCFNGNKVTMISTNTRGKSINQNFGILVAKGDILVFADDDIIFVDDYRQIILDYFNKHTKADAVKFYCESKNLNRPLSFKKPKKDKLIKKHEIMSAGTPLLAIKRDFLIRNGIFFNAGIGPGTDCANGEDGVFYSTLFKHKCKMYISPILIGYALQDNSSWFNKFDEKYFLNSGYIYRLIYGKLAFLYIFRKAWMFHFGKRTELGFFRIISMMNKGKNKCR